MVERSLSMREVPGSIPGFSKHYFFCLFFRSNSYNFINFRCTFASIFGAFGAYRRRYLACLKLSNRHINTDTRTHNPTGNCFSAPKISVRLTRFFALVPKI